MVSLRENTPLCLMGVFRPACYPQVSEREGNMKHHSQNRIKLDWVKDAPFAVRINRIVPHARHAPEALTDFFIPPIFQEWENPSFLS